MTATDTAPRIVTCPNCGKRNRLPAAAPRNGDAVPRCGNCRRALPWITDAGDGDFTVVVEQASIPVLVDIWATWCGPCRMVSPALEQLATERAGELKLVKVDIDAAPATSERFEVRAVPTLLLMRGGQVIARQAGAAPLPALRRWLDDGLATANTSTEEST